MEDLLSTIESKIPADDLKNEQVASAPVADYTPAHWNHKDAVVIEGPGFRHAGNTYETLENAQRAVRFLECRLQGEKFVLEPDAKPFGVSTPPEWRSATRMHIEEL